MTKHHPPGGDAATGRPAAPLNDTEKLLLQTLRMMGALNAPNAQPSEKIERKAHVKHGPMMHTLRELERKGMVARVVGRKDVNFHIR